MGITGIVYQIAARTGTNHSVTTASTAYGPGHQAATHTEHTLRPEACSVAIAGVAHIQTECCVAVSLRKASGHPADLINTVVTGIITAVDSKHAFRKTVPHKAYWATWDNNDTSRDVRDIAR